MNILHITTEWRKWHLVHLLIFKQGSLMIIFFLNMMQFSLVDSYLYFGWKYSFHFLARKVDAAQNSLQTEVYCTRSDALPAVIMKITVTLGQYHIWEDSNLINKWMTKARISPYNLHSQHWENLNPHKILSLQNFKAI